MSIVKAPDDTRASIFCNTRRKDPRSSQYQRSCPSSCEGRELYSLLCLAWCWCRDTRVSNVLRPGQQKPAQSRGPATLLTTPRSRRFHCALGSTQLRGSSPSGTRAPPQGWHFLSITATMGSSRAFCWITSRMMSDRNPPSAARRRTTDRALRCLYRMCNAAGARCSSCPS